MSSVAVVTLITKSHLPYARVLMESIRRWAPEARRFALLADRIDGAFDPALEDFEIVFLDTPSIQDSPWFYFKYSAMELNMALKPHAIQFLFERFGFDAVLYFDSDIRVYQALDPLFEKLKNHSLILTPHLTRPLNDGRRPSDLDILRAGIYNGGFLLLRNCGESGRFLTWWKARLQDHCLVDLPNGLFVDQRWLDFVPSLFPDAGILREPGFNVAYWNLGERRKGEPLYFVHFSGFDPERPEGISRHQNRHTLSTLGEVERTLFLDYAKDVLARGYKQCKDWPYAYGFFDNGIAISDAARRAFYESAEISDSIPNPFSDAGYQSLVQFWNDPPGDRGARRVTDLGYSGPGPPSTREASPERPLPRLAWSIYESRPDVQSAFPDPQAADRVRFLTWLLSAGAAEHGIGREFLGPLWREWEAALSGLGPLARARHRSLRWAMAAWRRGR
jgi:hypothetical protein